MLSLINPFRFPAPFLLFFPDFVVSIYIFSFTSTCFFLFDLVSLLSFVLIVIFHSPLICPCYLPILFYFYPILLDSLSPVPPFYPFLVSFLLSHCSMPPHSCRLCIVCTTSIHPSSTLYLLMPVLFYPRTNILPLMPPLLQFLFPCPLFLLFSSFAIFSGHRPQPNENENGQDSKVSGEVPYPAYPFRIII